MTREVPYLITLECEECGFDFKKIVWLPEDHNLGLVEEIKCPTCNNIMTVVNSEQQEVKLVKHDNRIGIKIGDITSYIMYFSPLENTIEIDISSLRHSLPFFNLDISDITTFGSPLVQIKGDSKTVKIFRRV